MTLYIELHSKNCACGGTGWITKIFKAGHECVEIKNASIIRYDHWLALGKPATQETLIQKVANKLNGQQADDGFVDALCDAIEKLLTQTAPLHKVINTKINISEVNDDNHKT